MVAPQIAATLKCLFPDEPERHVSHETIYTAIYTAIYAQPRGELRKQLVACLRHGRSTRMPRSRGEDRRGQITDMVSIPVRPPEVDSLNTRPRVTHNWHTPLEVFAQTLASSHKPRPQFIEPGFALRT